MARSGEASTAAEEALRQEAAAWFARLHGPDAIRHRSDFEVWAEADPRRRAAYDRLERRWDEAAVLVGAHPSARIASRRGRPRLSWRAPMGLVAAAGALALVVYLAPARPAFLDEVGVPSAWWRAVRTEVGQIRTERLADGASVTLDTDSLMLESASARPGARLVRGRARFEFVASAQPALEVDVGGASLTAQAARFDVTYVPGEGVSVVPLAGQVFAAVGPRWATRAFSARLHPGQAWSFRREAGARIEQAPVGAPLWPTGVLSFAETPLSAALAEANRYSRQHIVLADPALGALQVSGVFQARAPKALASALAAAFDLHVQDLANGDVELSRPSAASPIEPAR